MDNEQEVTAGDYTLVDEEPKNERRIPPADGPSLRKNMEAVKSEPNVWKRVAAFNARSTATGTANDLRQGRRGMPSGKWEIRTSRMDDGRHGLYAMFLGEE